MYKAMINELFRLNYFELLSISVTDAYFLKRQEERMRVGFPNASAIANQ